MKKPRQYETFLVTFGNAVEYYYFGKNYEICSQLFWNDGTLEPWCDIGPSADSPDAFLTRLFINEVLGDTEIVWLEGGVKEYIEGLETLECL